MEEGLDRGPSLHATALMRTVVIVFLQEGVEIDLHLREVFIPGFAALDAEMFVEEGAVEALKIAVGLRPSDLGGAVLDAFEL